MKICPTCYAQVAVLIVNVQSGQQFCHRCAGVVCSTFMSHFVVTKADVKWLREIGVDPEISRIEAHVKRLEGGTDEQ